MNEAPMTCQVGDATPGVTGWLEVEIVVGDQVVQTLHSKKNGQGYVDTEAKMATILNGVDDAIKKGL